MSSATVNSTTLRSHAARHCNSNEQTLRSRRCIDTLEDQVRLYPTTIQTFAERYIIGARTVEERADYWIVR